MWRFISSFATKLSIENPLKKEIEKKKLFTIKTEHKANVTKTHERWMVRNCICSIRMHNSMRETHKTEMKWKIKIEKEDEKRDFTHFLCVESGQASRRVHDSRTTSIVKLREWTLPIA